VGRLYCDLIFTGTPHLPVAGTETFADALYIDVGGGAYITAAMLDNLTRPSALMATIPAAPFGQIIQQDPLFRQLETSRCQLATPDTDPQVTVAITTPGDRAFLSRRAGPALPRLSAADFKGISHLHIGELRTLVEHPDLIHYARQAKASVSLDCSWDEELMGSAQDLKTLIGAVDIFLPNDSEMEMLRGVGLTPDCAPITVVKCGADGAQLFRGPQTMHMPAPNVPVVDTTGAGDAFNGGFIDAWLDGGDDRRCLERAIACGSSVVQAAGGTGALKKSAVIPAC
jgi:sugar/nucleoside kinase (ribokinase family)